MYKFICVFESYNHAFYFLKRMNERGTKLKIIETPTNLSSSCTKSVRFTENEFDKVKEELNSLNYEVRGIYKILDYAPFYFRLRY